MGQWQITNRNEVDPAFGLSAVRHGIDTELGINCGGVMPYAHLICHAEEGDAIPDNYVEQMPFLRV